MPDSPLETPLGTPPGTPPEGTPEDNTTLNVEELNNALRTLKTSKSVNNSANDKKDEMDRLISGFVMGGTKRRSHRTRRPTRSRK